MADKWADYLISAVRYNTAKTHIDKVEVRNDNGDSVGAPSVWNRTDVVSGLEDGDTFETITKGSDDKWNRGAAVGIVTVSGVKYIRTDADATPEDNLGSLPRF
ncbi:MAG TPA: DUF3892 domain-containing protein [Solirubrobacterales bacterium]